MTDDSLQASRGLRTLPTDEINYMRNSVKATVDAYDGTVTLYAWDDAGPDAQGLAQRLPGHGRSQGRRSRRTLLEHLRYPEDMFKVQRYQFARYHVTDPNDWFQDNNQWQVSLDPRPNIIDKFQAPVRMFTTDPETGQPVWSLTSNFVPRGKANLVGFVSADSDATSPDYGKILVEQPHNQNVPGPGQAFSNLISDPRITRKTQRFKLGDATPQYGNVIAVPLGSQVMYVVPVYATRAVSDTASSLTLRYVMVQYGSQVGIGDTLVHAITDMAGGSPPPVHHPGGGQHHPGKGSQAKARALLQKAERDFAAADRALQHGHGALWVKLNHQARAEVAHALNLLGRS